MLSALVAKVLVNVWDPESYKLGAKVPMMVNEEPAVGTYANFTIGSYRAPLVVPVMDKSRYPPRVKEYQVSGYEWRYYLEDSPANINSIIKKWGNPAKPFTVSIAQLNSPQESPYEGNLSYTINSKEDFINAPIEELIDMNKAGYVKKDNLDSVLDKYRKFKAKKAAIEAQTGSEVMPINAETAAFLKQNKLDIDSLVSQLKLNTIEIATAALPTQSQKKKSRK